MCLIASSLWGILKKTELAGAARLTTQPIAAAPALWHEFVEVTSDAIMDLISGINAYFQAFRNLDKWIRAALRTPSDITVSALHGP